MDQTAKDVLLKAVARLPDWMRHDLAAKDAALRTRAEEALAAGLVTEVLPDQPGLMARAHDLAKLCAGNAPLTLRATKEALRRLRDSLPADEDLIRLCYTSQDFREGMEAFLGKRPPVWRGQ